VREIALERFAVGETTLTEIVLFERTNITSVRDKVIMSLNASSPGY